MSKTRWDRNRSARSTPYWDSEYVPFDGGIDQSSDFIRIKPGRLVQCLNFEQAFGRAGYRTIRGYERYDGQTRPSDAVYHVLNYDAGSVAINVGDTADNTLGTASGRVVMNTITSGSVAGGDAAGVLVLTRVTGDFADNNPIRTNTSGVVCATANGPSERHTYASDSANWETRIRAAREYYRALINSVPGEGSILGGCVYDNGVYAVRNAVGGDTATLWYAEDGRNSGFMPRGWNSVKTGLHPDVEYKFEVASFSGDADSERMFVVNGRNRIMAFTMVGAAWGFETAEDIYGSEGYSFTNVTIGLGAKTFTVAGAGAKDWVAGDFIRIESLTNCTNLMDAQVVAYNSGTGQLDVTVLGILGSGTYNSWDIHSPNYSDRPYCLAAHKNHMFYGYPDGQLQTSDLGYPMRATTTAALFGIGATITGMRSLKGEALAVFTEKRIDVIRGSSSLDWDKTPYSDDAGAEESTVVANDGNPIFLGPRGVSTLQATQAFGDFETATFSADIKKTLDALRGTAVAARIASNNYQYRLYFSDGTNLRFTVQTGNAVITPRDVSPTISKYTHPPTCVFSGHIDGHERMFFGTSDGYIMEEDVGTSFDGESISYVMRLPHHHIKGAVLEKQFHKMALVQESGHPITLNYRYFFDNQDGSFTHGSVESSLPGLPENFFDVGAFDSIVFDQSGPGTVDGYIDGIGTRVSVLFWMESDMADETTLQGIFMFFTRLGVPR